MNIHYHTSNSATYSFIAVEGTANAVDDLVYEPIWRLQIRLKLATRPTTKLEATSTQ